MVTILKANGFRFVIFTDDHEPAHVYIFGGGQAKVNFEGRDGRPDLLWAEGMKRNDLRRAMAIIDVQQELFLTKWREIHG